MFLLAVQGVLACIQCYNVLSHRDVEVSCAVIFGCLLIGGEFVYLNP